MLHIQEHNAGFFSCFTVRLHNILNYFNNLKQCPESIDSSKLFNYYKIDIRDDITKLLFEQNNEEKIEYKGKVSIVTENYEDQFSPYKELNYNEITPFINKYFTPSQTIMDIKHHLITKYNIDNKNTCSVFYRGNDKARETNQPSYEEIINKAKEIKSKDIDIQFLLQTDENELCIAFKENFPNAIVFNEIPQLNKCDSSIQYHMQGKQSFNTVVFYFASILIMAETKYIISTSGNGEMWVQLYRKNSDGLYQYLNHKDYIYGIKNKATNGPDYWY